MIFYKNNYPQRVFDEIILLLYIIVVNLTAFRTSLLAEPMTAVFFIK